MSPPRVLVESEEREAEGARSRDSSGVRDKIQYLLTPGNVHRTHHIFRRRKDEHIVTMMFTGESGGSDDVVKGHRSQSQFSPKRLPFNAVSGLDQNYGAAGVVEVKWL